MELSIDRLPKGMTVLDLRISDEREILDQLPALAGWFETGTEGGNRDDENRDDENQEIRCR